MPRGTVDDVLVPKQFKQLNPSALSATSFAFLVGRRGTGKTIMMKDLAYNFFINKCKDGENIDMAIVFSPTEGMQKVFEKFVPKAFIYSTFREDLVVQLLETQKQLIEKNGHTATVLLFIDDCAYNKKFFTSDTFRELAMNGRHCKIFVLCAVQYCMDIEVSIRSNFDVVFIMKDNSAANVKRYHTQFFSQFSDYKQFAKTFNRMTANFGAMVSLVSTNSTNLQETTFWYRAKPKEVPERFPIGRRVFWKMQKFCPKNAFAAGKEESIIMLDQHGNNHKSEVSSSKHGQSSSDRTRSREDDEPSNSGKSGRSGGGRSSSGRSSSGRSSSGRSSSGRSSSGSNRSKHENEKTSGVRAEDPVDMFGPPKGNRESRHYSGHTSSRRSHRSSRSELAPVLEFD
jgi:uncharacterized membrane protein YgcG